jgi:DNA-binding Lrp family transcriptional regulator
MVSAGVIQEFIADIDFSILGYRIWYILSKQQEEKNRSSTRDGNSDSNRRKKVVDHLNQIGDILAEIEILGGAHIFRLAIKEAHIYKENTRTDDHIRALLDAGAIQKVIPVSSGSVQSDTHNMKQSGLRSTDLKILRCLVLNPQIGVGDISDIAAVSIRTVNRILNKLKDDRVIRFSVICNPAAMKGLVVFGLLIYINEQSGTEEKQKKDKKFHPHKILERLYTEFPDYPFLRSPLISHDNIIVVSVYGNDVFAIDSMFKRILSFEEVNNAELYVFTRIDYHKEWIIRDIDNRLESKL